MMVLKTAVAHLIRKFKISTRYEKVADIKLKQEIVLKPVDGYKVILENREES